MGSQTAQGVARRDLLKQGLIWGGAAATGTVLMNATPASARPGQKRIAYDVACLGDTFRIHFQEGNVEGDLRGSTFSVEGNIYPEGTIAGSGFDPASATPIGRWLCRGWFLINPDRPEPHVISTQEYVLGAIRTGRLYPPNQLVSSGMEGSADESDPPIRSIIGGTGKFAREPPAWLSSRAEAPTRPHSQPSTSQPRTSASTSGC